jgi:hypothetical protein
MSYDAKCAELARVFLSDVKKDDDAAMVAELAQEIQDAIEGFFFAKELKS